MEDPLQLLARTELFQSLPAEELKRLAGMMRRVTFLPGEFLFQEGDIGQRFYLAAEGCVEIIKALGQPEESLLRLCYPGDFIGEMSLLYNDGRRMASARSQGSSTLLEMTRQEFDDLLNRWPRLAYEMLRVVSRRMAESQDQAIQDLHVKNELLQAAYDELKAAQAQLVEKERLERELQLAREIQMSILPVRLPQIPGFEFGARIEPARAVGGDFFDFIPLPHRRIGVVIGDVTDKGIPAAIFMAQASALLHAEASRNASPGKALQRANRHLLRKNEECMFATVLYGVLDTGNGQFHYARAGHEQPLLDRSQQGIIPIPMTNSLPLGLMEDLPVDEQILQLEPGDNLLLFTDGLTDGLTSAGSNPGAPLAKDLLPGFRGLGAQELCERFLQEILARQMGDTLFDDVMLLAIQAR